MPSNYRIHYPLHYLALGPEGSQSGLPVFGVQSVSISTAFNLTPVFELGQLETYEQIEELPSVEISVQKVLDGEPLAYHLGTRGATDKSLLNRTNQKADAIISLFSDLQENASGAPLTQVYCSGVYINSLSYSLPVQGMCTEDTTWVGNDKTWKTSSFLFNGHFSGGDTPNTTVQRRQHVLMGLNTAGGSTWPSLIPGLTVSNGSGFNVETAGQFGTHIQDVSISCNLNRSDILELGRKRPFYRYVNYPVTVDCTINILTSGSTPGDLVNVNGNGDNLSNEPIIIKLNDGTVFHLGTKNKLMSISQSGGDTGGSLGTISYQFQNYNKLDVTSASDPLGFT